MNIRHTFGKATLIGLIFFIYSCNRIDKTSSYLIDFSNTKIDQKNIEYKWNDLTIKITETTSEDCDGGGRCFFSQNENELFLAPARLVIDISNLERIDEITISGNDNCTGNCTKFFLYDKNNVLIKSNSLDNGFGAYSLTIDSDLKNATTLAISSCEASVEKIIIQ